VAPNSELSIKININKGMITVTNPNTRSLNKTFQKFPDTKNLLFKIASIPVFSSKTKTKIAKPNQTENKIPGIIQSK
jgi:hypothetical protein